MSKSSIFTEIVRPKVKFSKFDLSHGNKLTCNMGELIPILCEEVVPNDTFNLRAEVLIRLAPMIAPAFHSINAFVHWFFVPNRLLWNATKKDSWETFITAGKDGLQAPEVPNMILSPSDAALGNLGDYLGLNVSSASAGASAETRINILPLRAYQLIYNEYYRDPNLSDDLFDEETDGYISLRGGELSKASREYLNLVSLRRRAWEHDYFTSCLPNPQRGAAVPIPVSIAATPEYRENQNLPQTAAMKFRNIGPTPLQNSSSASFEADFGDGSSLLAGNVLQQMSYVSGLDVSGTMQDLRTANRLQQFLENMMRGGHRYIETILSHFGVRGKDATLQRPQFLGGGMQPVQISEVAQTSASDPNVSPQGNLAGRAISIGADNGVRFHADEHGWIIGILSVMPRTGYFQGLHRKFSRFDRLDYFWPEFANLGEQAVLNKEVYNDPSDGLNDEVFGYIPRYAEYKYHNDEVHGDFKDSLVYWHLARKFDSRPALNETFVTSIPSERIFASTDTSVDKLWCNIYIHETAVRPMPYYGSPMW